MISPHIEEYLEAIGRLEELGQPITPSALARACRVSRPTVTEMLQRLSNHGLIDYEPRRRVSLTPHGRQQATRVLRRHRLWERFLHDVLGLRWDRVHDQACRLEHATSPELEERLAQTVGASATCPHGHPIPGKGQAPPDEGTLSLSELAPQQTARVLSVQEEDAGLLRRLGQLGIRPGAVVRREEAHPEQGSLALSLHGESRSVQHDAAARVRVQVLPPGEAPAGPQEIIPLADLPSGQTGRIHQFLAGRGMVSRCLALGFTPGTSVRMIQNLGHGPVVVLVRDTRVALGRGQAQKILVTREVEPHGE